MGQSGGNESVTTCQGKRPVLCIERNRGPSHTCTTNALRPHTLRARGQAAAIEEDGRALAEVLEMMTTAWLKAGDDAKDIFLIQQLEGVLTSVVERINNVQIGEVVLLDSGNGEALPAYVGAYPAMVKRLLLEVRESTGVDVTGILAGLNTQKEVS